MRYTRYLVVLLGMIALAGCGRLNEAQTTQINEEITEDTARFQPALEALEAEERAYQEGLYAGTLKEVVREGQVGGRVQVKGYVSDEIEPGIYMITDGTEEMAFRVGEGLQVTSDTQVSIEGAIVLENGLRLILVDRIDAEM